MADPIQKNRAALLLIAGLPVTVILLASWLWFYVSSGKIDLVDLLGTANKGDLLSPPLPLRDVGLLDSDGGTAELFTHGNRQWRILIPAAGACGETCEENLYITRQIRTAMGKYSNRIERIYLAADAEVARAFPADLRQQHPGLKVLYTPRGEATELWADLALEETGAAYFLVDPAGWIMMFYPTGTNGKDVMADLNFLLKNSSG